jgi:hypothetical protein
LTAALTLPVSNGIGNLTKKKIGHLSNLEIVYLTDAAAVHLCYTDYRTDRRCFMRMHRVLMLFLLGGAMVIMAACNTSLPQGHNGSIGLMPFWDEEMGIQGVAPSQGWSDRAQLVQGSIPGTLDDAIAIVLEQTSLTSLPEPIGHYDGRAFTWDLWTTETQLMEVGPQTLHLDLAMAEGDSAAYFIALVVMPEAYRADPALYDTVFAHALYALEPLE